MNLNSIKEEDLKDVFDELEDAFKTLNIDYYLIGAIARDVWYSQRGKTSRTSKDVDFAVLVGSEKEYQTIREYLKNNKGFNTTAQNGFVLITPGGITVDILPFGGIEIDASVKLDAVGMSSIKVNGFHEVYLAGTNAVTLKTGHHFKVATLPAIVLLKLIAFDDRPEKREKDPRDIANIIEHFFDLKSELVYSEQNLDIFQVKEEELNKMTMQDIASIIIGRELALIIAENDNLKTRIINMLEKHIALTDKSLFIRNMAIETAKPIMEMTGWLTHMLNGLTHTPAAVPSE